MTAVALGDDTINLNVTNDGTEDIFLSVVDLSTTPHTKVVDHQRVNGFTTVPVLASADNIGRANIAWTTISVDSDNRRCGHGVRRGLDNDGAVNVHVDSECGR
jgi:hypothetical protein